MKATLYSHTTALGTIALKNIDASMGVVGGILTPNGSYFRYQRIFRDCHGTHNFEITDLGLNIQLENGCFLHASGGYSIHDIPEFPDEITVHVVGSNYFNIFSSLTEDVLPFVHSVWTTITVETKMDLEEELEKEIRLFRRKKQFSHHPYANYRFYALARDERNDDVLFYAIGKGNIKFVVIHLTWIGQAETDPTWPSANWYLNWEEFAERMEEDAEGWEEEEE
ncbi:hypothetical protein [Chitinophaga sp. Cy-1792]|uniref:hypothetical protein n=1 Tax=Chitinophaga sp. Cy-1792 TaxID=2608339 RepID=UPI00141F4564|nr:hypothetical protein [Chitinophaga sp. Cy-1792]NIG55311.1 hypothetical protein [Chitinophaga sp. Cy-1792]